MYEHRKVQEKTEYQSPILLLPARQNTSLYKVRRQRAWMKSKAKSLARETRRQLERWLRLGALLFSTGGGAYDSFEPAHGCAFRDVFKPLSISLSSHWLSSRINQSFNQSITFVASYCWAGHVLFFHCAYNLISFSLVAVPNLYCLSLGMQS